LEAADGDLDEKVITFRHSGPEALVEDPVGIGGEGEAVVEVVVAAFGMFVDVAGLHDRAVIGFQSIACESTGVVVAADHVRFEAGIAAFALLGLEFFGVLLELGNFCGIRHGDSQARTEHHLFARSKITDDHGLARLMPKVSILQAGEKLRIERTESRGFLGMGDLAFGSEAFPDFVAVAAEGVKGHGDLGFVLLALANQFPIISKARDEADVVFHPAIGHVAGFDEIHDCEHHQRLVRGDASACGLRGIKVREFSEPVGSEIRRHDEKVVVRKSMKFFSLLSIVDIHFEFDEPLSREGAKV